MRARRPIAYNVNGAAKSVTECKNRLYYNPLPALLSSRNDAVVFFARCDLLDEKTDSVRSLWDLPEPRKILRGQQADGSWKKPGKRPEPYPPGHDSLVETYKRYRILVEKYGFTKDHPSLSRAAEFLFSFQTEGGDIRGFIGNQYATYYTGDVLALLIHSGYRSDARVGKGLRWLLTMRQNDGGWAVPFLTHAYDRRAWIELTSTDRPSLEPDRARPFSHMATDMVLRGFAAHSRSRRSREAGAAGALLKSRFFKPDAYTSYRSPKYWTRFLFWWPNLLTSLSSLALLGFSRDDPDIAKGIAWFLENQRRDGLWDLESGKPAKPKDREARFWLGLNVCRMLKKYSFTIAVQAFSAG